jgi:hypothetical protein
MENLSVDETLKGIRRVHGTAAYSGFAIARCC